MEQEYKLIIRNDTIKKRACEIINKLKIDTENNRYYEVVIKTYRRNRSGAQNRLLHMWLGIIAKDTGDDAGSLKLTFRENFLEPIAYEDRITKETKTRIPSTSELNVNEFTKFLTDIEHFCNHELNIRLPHPGDMWLEAMGRGI